MNQEYEVIWMEHKPPTKTGKTVASVTLRSSTGEEDTVSLWGDFPDFSNVRPGSKVMGTIVPKPDAKGRVWKSLQGGKFAKPVQPKPQASQMVDMMGIKQKGIEKAQDAKADSIRMSSTFRDATLLTLEWIKQRTARGLATSTEEWQTEWRAIRNWLDGKFNEPFN